MMFSLQDRIERAEWWRDHLRARCRRGIERKPVRRVVLITQVLVAVCEYYGITPEDVTGRERQGETLRARQIGMFVARKFTGRPYVEIGRQFGGFDHATVIHACRKVEAMIDDDPEIRSDVDSIAGAVLDGW